MRTSSYLDMASIATIAANPGHPEFATLQRVIEFGLATCTALRRPSLSPRTKVGIENILHRAMEVIDLSITHTKVSQGDWISSREGLTDVIKPFQQFYSVTWDQYLRSWTPASDEYRTDLAKINFGSRLANF